VVPRLGWSGSGTVRFGATTALIGRLRILTPESPAVSLRSKWDESPPSGAFTSVPFQEQLFDYWHKRKGVVPNQTFVPPFGCEPRGTHTHASQPPLRNDTMNMVSIRVISNPVKVAPAIPLGLSTTSRRRM